MNKKERCSQIRDVVKEIPVSDVIEKRISVVRRGSNAFALCPFHADTKIGSFVITDNKGLWKCFACPDGISGDGPKFISLFDEISYSQAVIKIALEFGIIEEREAKALTTNSKAYNVDTLFHYEAIIQDNKTEKADEKTIHYIYSIMVQGLTLESNTNKRLSEEHRKYLNNRGINDDTIQKNEYFTFPTRKAMRKINSILKKRGFNQEILVGVPGFYLNKKTKLMTFAYNKGIGIPIYNENQKIVGIQIRRDEIKEGQVRYIWFSSSFANMNDDSDLGTAQGAPIDVCFPTHKIKPTIFITEGHFKADKLSETFNSIALSVQGIGNWKGIDKTIENLKNKHEMLKSIYIAYDADASHNINVGIQAIKMASLIHSKFPAFNIYFILWNEEHGKGIDDLLMNYPGDYTKFFKVEKQDFDKRYNLLLMKLMQRFNVLNVNDIGKKMMEEYGREESITKVEEAYVKIVFAPLEKKYKYKKVLTNG